MSERIRELALQAGLFHKVNDNNFYPTYLTAEQSVTAYQKFAELIVAECMRMCDVAAIGYESHNHFKEANGCYSAKEYIEEHFRVEE